MIYLMDLFQIQLVIIFVDQMMMMIIEKPVEQGQDDQYWIIQSVLNLSRYQILEMNPNQQIRQIKKDRDSFKFEQTYAIADVAGRRRNIKPVSGTAARATTLFLKNKG